METTGRRFQPTKISWDGKTGHFEWLTRMSWNGKQQTWGLKQEAMKIPAEAGPRPRRLLVGMACHQPTAIWVWKWGYPSMGTFSQKEMNRIRFIWVAAQERYPRVSYLQTKPYYYYEPTMLGHQEHSVWWGFRPWISLCPTDIAFEHSSVMFCRCFLKFVSNPGFPRRTNTWFGETWLILIQFHVDQRKTTWSSWQVCDTPKSSSEFVSRAFHVIPIYSMSLRILSYVIPSYSRFTLWFFDKSLRT